MRLYALAAAAVLAASSLTWILLGDEDGALLTIAGILFWASGATLIVLGLIVLGRLLGVTGASGRGRPASGGDDPEP